MKTDCFYNNWCKQTASMKIDENRLFLWQLMKTDCFYDNWWKQTASMTTVQRLASRIPLIVVNVHVPCKKYTGSTLSLTFWFYLTNRHLLQNYTNKPSIIKI